jgi:hypothetical protein
MMNTPQILKEGEISNYTQLSIEHQILQDTKFPNKPQLQTYPRF